MTCTLDLYTDYLISSTGQTSATGLSRRLDGEVSHDHVTRWLRTSYLDSAQVWAQAKPLIRRAEQQRPAEEFAVLIVDDSILEKARTDPSAVELIEKTEAVWDAKAQKTKTKNLRVMLRVALPGRPQQQVAYRYPLADSWYASAENLNAVLDLGHHFVVVLESSRTVALSEAERAQGRFQAVDALAFPDGQPLRVLLRSVQSAVLVTRQVFTNKDGSQGGLYSVSSDMSLNQAQLTTICQRRWKVEEYHKSLKQNASMGKSPTKMPDTQANHFFAATLAYTKLEVLKLKCEVGYFCLKAQLYLAGLKAMHQESAYFTA